MEEKDYNRLRRKIVFTTLCFSLLPLFSLGLTIHHQFRVSYTGKIKEDLRDMVENRQSAIEIFFEERVAQLNLLAGTHTLQTLADQAKLEDAFSILQGHSHSFVDLGVIDENGQHVAYVGPYNLMEVNYKDADWFSAAMVRRVYVSDVFLGFRRIPHFVIAVVCRKENRNWLLRATINSEIFDNIVRAARVGRKGDAFIINRDGIFQTKPRLSGAIMNRSDCFDLTKLGSGTHVEEAEIGGKKALFATAWIKNNEWLLVLKEAPEEELKPLFRAQYISAGLLVGGIVVIILGTVFTTRSMMARLIQADREKAMLDVGLVQSSKMAALGKLAAGVAHEVNNPLAVIKEKAGWMKDLLEEEDIAKSENFQEFEDAIGKIDQHVERARKVTHRLLGFGRRMEPVKEMVDINKTLDEAVDFLENEARYRNIDVQADYYENLSQIRSDPAQVQQVFLNILDNAIDAIGKDGEINIRTYPVSGDSEIVVAISDNGPGISEEMQKKIFDPFFTTKKVGEGIGLGLSISFGIIEKLGGRITVESKEGQGATFKVFLPIGRGR